MPTLSKELNEENKSEYVNSMFANIAAKYDLLNNIMTFGLHNKWKTDALQRSLKELSECKTALDLCSGTGDLCIILNKLSNSTKIIYSDNCKEMLDTAKNKFEKIGFSNIEIKCEDAEKTNYPNNYFDLITIGFGIRNLTKKEETINSIFNHLNNGGVFMCIDLGHPINPIWKKIYFIFFYQIVPYLGKIFAKDKEAYTYLPESLKTWYTQNELKDILIKAGFKECKVINYCGGVVSAHIAKKS